MKCGGKPGGGNDARRKSLRASLRAWKSLRDSHIPTARLLLYILKTYFRKEPSSPPAPFPFRLILGLEKTAGALTWHARCTSATCCIADTPPAGNLAMVTGHCKRTCAGFHGAGRCPCVEAGNRGPASLRSPERGSYNEPFRILRTDMAQ